ncbi:uncharacterized protein [Anoplolepis gracilipes]|uniref:uncharacterized protein n=1 Tax=Anoplolepis gracilipes TaxID=354296 RepID=UPI003BA0E720
MSINKFGVSLGTSNNAYYEWNRLLRTYVRDNALCLTSAGFDARLRKIRRVAQPEDDNDAVNKRPTRPIAIARVEGNRLPRINEDRTGRLSLRRRRQADTSPEAGPSRRARIVLTPEPPVIDLTEGDTENDTEEPLSGEVSSIDEVVIFSQIANYIAANEEVRNEDLMEGNEEAEIELGEMTEEEEEEEEEEMREEEEGMREAEEEAEDEEEEEEEENDINDVSMIEEVQIGGGKSGEIQRQQDQHQQVRVGEEKNHSHADEETRRCGKRAR